MDLNKQEAESPSVRIKVQLLFLLLTLLASINFLLNLILLSLFISFSESILLTKSINFYVGIISYILIILVLTCSP